MLPICTEPQTSNQERDKEERKGRRGKRKGNFEKAKGCKKKITRRWAECE
jgi:hypothetical protein